MLRLAPTLLASLLVLSCGGSSRPPGSPGGTPSTSPTSPAAVGTVELTVTAAPGRELPALVWYPAERPGPGAPPVLGRKLPVVAISHGLGGKKEHAAFLAERLAGAGYLVAAVDHVSDGIEIAAQRPVDITKLLDRLAARGGEPAWLADLADLDRVAVYGHSFGGYTALALGGAKVGPNPEWTALCTAAPATPGCPAPTPAQMQPMSRRDPRVDAVVAATPGGYIQFGQAGTAAIETPIVLLAAGKDRLITTPQFVRPLFDHARQPRWLFEIELANHFTFVDLCAKLAKIPPPFHDEVAEACAPDAPIPLATAHALIGDVVVASLDHLLKGSAAPDLDALAKARGIAARTDAAR